MLQILFVNAGQEHSTGTSMTDAWHHGNAETLARRVHEVYRDFPSLGERLIDRRNWTWISKIEGYCAADKPTLLLSALVTWGTERAAGFTSGTGLSNQAALKYRKPKDAFTDYRHNSNAGSMTHTGNKRLTLDRPC